MANVQKRLSRYVMGAYIFLVFFPSAGHARDDLARKIGQMIMVGFEGTNVPDTLAVDLQKHHLGGVILFAHNMENPEQIKRLTSDLMEKADLPVLIATDQEGGHVARLSKNNGFDKTYSAFQLGTVFNSEDSTRTTAARMASWMSQTGINMNLAPVVDVNINPDSPAIGHWERSFSDDPERVALHAGWFIEEFRRRNIITTLKHFPGHGSAKQDSHLGFTDITTTWTEKELIPYQMLFANHLADVVMVGHLFNANLDPKYPATLSDATISGILQSKLGFRGVVISDEMFMGAITNNYSFDEAIELAINAGIDILLYRTNLINGRSLVQQIITTVSQKVAMGKISPQRIDSAYAKILALKAKWFNLTEVRTYTAGSIQPNRFELRSFPNPFINLTHIQIRLERTAHVKVQVLDLMGRQVALIADQTFRSGKYQFAFRAGNLPSGIYFIKLQASGKTLVRKISLVR